jgi:hypothetical protein
MCNRPHLKLTVVGTLAAALLVASAGAAEAGTPTIPVLIQNALYAKSHAPAKKTIELSLPRQMVRAAREASKPALLPTTTAPAPSVNGLFFGPSFFDGQQATAVRNMVSTMPKAAKKLLTGPVGPWAMSGAAAIGNSWSAGPAMYARF